MKLSSISLLLLRLAISYIWLEAGISKLLNPKFIESFPSTIEAFAKNTNFDFYTDFLNKYILPNSQIVAQLTVWGEILTGIVFLLGFPLLVGVLVGIFMNANYFLVATSAPSQFVNLILIFSQFAVWANGAGSIWGLDAKLVKK